jgi:glutaminyl-peptide cyclotransferase
MRCELIAAIFLLIVIPLIACTASRGPSNRSSISAAETDGSEVMLKKSIPNYTYEVINFFPHDRSAFTQGLIYFEDFLYESTGLNGSSSLRMADLATGSVLKKVDVPSQFFAEGMTIFQGKIFQLTWLSHTGFIYDLGSFQKIGEFTYDGEGWGLTHDNKHLIMSDGTNRIRFLDPDTLEVKKSISVFNNDVPLMNINELEFIKGEIYANIWQTDTIVRINPKNGKIKGFIDLRGLLSAEDRVNRVDVLNGIAYDEINDRLFITGKLWPKIFEIRLVKK